MEKARTLPNRGLWIGGILVEKESQTQKEEEEEGSSEP